MPCAVQTSHSDAPPRNGVARWTMDVPTHVRVRLLLVHDHGPVLVERGRVEDGLGEEVGRILLGGELFLLFPPWAKTLEPQVAAAY